jgi:uracil-DNA glycosylase family 4
MSRAKPNSCIGCVLHGHGTDFSRIEGTGSNGTMLIGEASGEHEQREGTPFVNYAPAGGVLERVLRRMGVDRQQLSVTNVLRCRPRNNWLESAPWEYSAISHCRSNLDAAIAERRPRAIVALGGIATRELTGMAGEAQGVGHLCGYALPYRMRIHHDDSPLTKLVIPTNIPVVPAFHPAFIRRGKASHTGVLARNIQRALNIAKGTDRDWLWNIDPEDRTTYGQLRYQIHPSLDEAREFVQRVEDNTGLVVSYDIETRESASLDEDARDGFADTSITLIQFSVGEGSGIAFPWEGEYRRLAQRVLHAGNAKCGHNVWLFDNKVLAAAGAREGIDLTPKGVIHDTLAMFHHWQPDLPAHLQFAASFVQFPFPWKHLAGSHLAFYGCADVDATLRLYGMLRRTLERDGLWGDPTIGYMGQVYEVRPVLAAMESRGMPIDDIARVRLGEEFERAQGELGRELSGLAGDCGLVDIFVGLNPELRKWFLDHGTQPKLWQEHPQDEICEMMATPHYDSEGARYHYEYRKVKVAGIDAADEPAEIEETRWCRVWDFNPNSGPQLIKYMESKGHPVPKDKHREDDSGANPDTTAAKELMRLANKTGDTFYLKVIEYRGLTKMRGTYVDGFAPGPDGRVHTTFGFGTGIGQLTSKNPNVQNFPKLKPTKALADAMRKMVAAEPGHVITEWDFKSCHVITLGFLAEDEAYMRLGRLDIHSFVAGHLLHLWDGRAIFNESDDELRARFKWLKANPEWKRVRDDEAKHGILGIGNGLKAKGLFERYMENFPPRACKDCMGSGKVAGVRGLKQCPACKGSGMLPGQRAADLVLETAEALFPKVFAWQKRIQRVAHDQQFLKTEFGHIRRFYEVFRWDSKRRDWGHGDQAEEAIAFWLANIAFGHIREKLKELNQLELDSKYGLFNNVHDSYLFMFPKELLDEHIQEVYKVLVSPSKVLRHPTICPNGLVIDVEASVGMNWAEMEQIPLGQPMEAQDTGNAILGEGRPLSRVGT